MALRAVARARTSGMARSIDRSPSRGSAAGDPERVRRGPAHQRAVEPDQRPHRAARRERALRAGVLRQFRLSRRPTDVRASTVFAQLPNLDARTCRIDPGAGSLLPANGHPGHLRRVRQHRLRQKPGRAAVDVRPSSAPSSAPSGASRRSTRVSITGMKRWPTRPVLPGQPASMAIPSRFETPRDLMRLL